MSCAGVVLYRGPMPCRRYAALFAVLLVLAFGVLFAVSPLTDVPRPARRLCIELPGSYLPTSNPCPRPEPERLFLLRVALIELFVDRDRRPGRRGTVCTVTCCRAYPPGMVFASCQRLIARARAPLATVKLTNHLPHPTAARVHRHGRDGCVQEAARVADRPGG